MLDENECLTAMVLAGCSPLYTKQVQRALATLDADQRGRAVEFLAWLMGHGEPPRLVRAEASAD